MTTARNALENAINVWTERYLQYAPIDGELEYLGFWRENKFCQFRTGGSLRSSDKGDFFGRL